MLNVPGEKTGKPVHVLLHVSGSIACYKACDLAGLLVKKGYEVQVTASSGSFHFLQPAVFEGLTHRPLLTDVFGGKPDYIPHITLAQHWADVIIAYPASADCICRLAAGLSDDLFGAVCLANNYRRPLLIAPAMNSEMLEHPAVRNAFGKLASWGSVILPTDTGHLACGSTGNGKLLSPERAVDFIDNVLIDSCQQASLRNSFKKRSDKKVMRILITGGGCREPIDGVRCITNTATGKTASFLADWFSCRGVQVTALMSNYAVLPESYNCRIKKYGTAAELSSVIQHELSEFSYDAVIHAAAVSDFRPANITINGEIFHAGKNIGKISSDSNLAIVFEPVPKIAGKIKKWAAVGNHSGRTVVICFKLTDGSDRTKRLKASLRLLEQSSADYVVSNDLTELNDSKHPFELFGKGSTMKLNSESAEPGSVCRGETLDELAQALESIL